MSKIKNSVYGLALGDAIAYRTEFLGFKESVIEYRNEHLPSLNKKLNVSDDTQMSLYLIKGFKEGFNPEMPLERQKYEVTEAIALNFVAWLNDPENCRAPGNACISSLMILDKALSEKKAIASFVGRKAGKISSFLVGGEYNSNSKGSGTVMRSPWLGILHAEGIIPDELFEQFCNTQASITHQHPTALHGSYLTALLTSELYKGNLKPGELHEFATAFCLSQESDMGWRDLAGALEKAEDLADDYAFTDAMEYDPSAVMGSRGTAEDVLATAIVLIDTFGDNPAEVIKRCMFNSGDSDTIGAVAGGMLGAYYDENIWEDLEHLVESQYVPWLDETVLYLQTINKPAG